MNTLFRRALILVCVAILIHAARLVGAQVDPTPSADERLDRFGPLAQFIGRWEGTADGIGGAATTTSHVESVLDHHFLQWRVESIIPADENGQGGETHHDIAMISYDGPRDRHMLRQFLSEGYVNTYVLHPDAAPNESLIFESIDVEGLPEGWRVRLVYRFETEDRYSWELHLGPPDQDYFQCRHGVMKRTD